MMKTKGIYLDEPFSNAFIVLGYNEGIIPSYTGGQSDYEKRFIANFTNPEYSRIALHNLVLYEKIYLYPYFDNFVVDELRKDKIVELPNLGPYYSPDIKFTEKNVIETGILYPALAHLKTTGIDISEKQLMETLRRGDLEQHGSLLMRRYELKAEKLLGDASKTVERELKQIEDGLSSIGPLFNALDRVSKLVNASSSLGVPALWNCLDIPSSKVIPTVKSDDTIVAGIYFRELKRIKVNSLRDAIELREDKAIGDFRNEVLDMTEQVREGKADEEKIKKRIELANRILDACDLAGKAGIVITIAGIPALAIPILGTILTFTVVSLVTAEFVAKRKFQWALISNR